MYIYQFSYSLLRWSLKGLKRLLLQRIGTLETINLKDVLYWLDIMGDLICFFWTYHNIVLSKWKIIKRFFKLKLGFLWHRNLINSKSHKKACWKWSMKVRKGHLRSWVMKRPWCAHFLSHVKSHALHTTPMVPTGICTPNCCNISMVLRHKCWLCEFPMACPATL